MEEVAAVVLAGGRGTRLAGVLDGIPKPLAQAHGRPFVEWVVRFLAARGIRRVRLATGHRAAAIEEHFRHRPVPGVDLACVTEAQPLGTGGAIVNAIRGSGLRPLVWLICAGDSLLVDSLDGLFDALESRRVGAAMAACRVPDASRFGTLELGPDGLLHRLAEKRHADGEALINAGIYLFPERTLRLFPEQLPCAFETEAIPALLARGCRIAVHPSGGPFLDIGTPASLAAASRFVAAHERWFR